MTSSLVIVDYSSTVLTYVPDFGYERADLEIERDADFEPDLDLEIVF
jgi:hypothetical protein